MELVFDLETVLMLYWIVSNRTVYMDENAFGINDLHCLICPKTKPNKSKPSWLYPQKMRISPLPKRNRDILDIILNFIYCWGSSSRILGSGEYFFIAITPRSTFNRIGIPFRIWAVYQRNLLQIMSYIILSYINDIAFKYGYCN